MNRKNYEVIVLVNGKGVKEYGHKGKNYIEGRKGTEFAIKVKNNSARKILAVISVDGLSVLTGDAASHDSSGYIVPAYNSVVIDGWRVSDEEVKKFFFTSADNSYAVRKEENGNNVGVIGVAIFREKDVPLVVWNIQNIHPHVSPSFPYPPLFPTCTVSSSNQNGYNLLDSNDSLDTCMLSSEIGTGWGETKESSVVSVGFEKEEYVDEQFIIFYNSYSQLKKIGVDFTKRPQYITPCAFPVKYCKPPELDY